MSLYVDHAALKHLLKKLKDVLIVSPTDGQVLTYVEAAKKWENKDPVAGAAHALSYLEGTTNVNTESTTFVNFLGEYSTTSSWFLNVVANKPVEFLFFCCIRSPTAGTLADFILYRSLIANGYPTRPISGGTVYCALAGPNVGDYQQFPITFFKVDTPTFNGRMNLVCQWRSPAGITICNDGTYYQYLRRGLAKQLLA